MPISAPIGVFDILPTPVHPSDVWCTASLWNHVEEVMRSVAHDYGCHEIRTPIFESADLFRKSVGDETDIVSKEMYVFEDRGGRHLALRPEGTASVMRALVEHKLFTPIHDLRLFYISPMFRYERPQAGRFRQHHQFGMEVIGVSAFEQDAEIIEALYSLYQRLEIPDLSVRINSLGSLDAREEFRKAFISYLTPHQAELSADSRRRFERNPLRILDSKDPGDHAIIEGAPSILDFLDPQDKTHFDGVLKTLDLLQIPYQIEPKLVRGIDYYQKTVFEVTTSALGAQNAIGAGGRYDGLLKRMGGPDLPSIGFGTGLERIIQTMLRVHAEKAHDERLYVFKDVVDLLLIPLGEKGMDYSIALCRSLRRHGLRVLVDMTGKKLKSAITQAVQASIRAVLVIGEEEIQSGRGRMKWLASSTEEEVHLSDLLGIRSLLQKCKGLES